MAKEVEVKDMLKFQQEKTTIEKDAREIVDPPFADAIRRGIRANKIKEETLKVEPTPVRELNPRLPKMRNGAKEMRLTLDESLFREVKEEDKKLKNESLEEKEFTVTGKTKDFKNGANFVVRVKAKDEEDAKRKFQEKETEVKILGVHKTTPDEIRKGITIQESLVNDEIDEFFKLCKKLGVETLGDLNRLLTQEPETDVDGTEIEKLRAYAKEINPRGLYLRNESLTKGNLKEGVKVGSKIRIVNMEGEPRYKGKEGVVKEIDDMGQLHGTWGGLAVIPEEDEFEILEEKLEENNIEDELEKLPAVYQVNKVKDNTYKLETNWERTHRRAVSNYLTIRRALEKKFGKDGFKLTYVKDETRDEGKEVHCVLKVEIKKEELTEAHREESDSWEVEELVLYIKNDSELYDRYTKPNVINLARKLNKGIFDKDIAVKAFLYVVDAGVRKYRKEFKAEDGYEQFRFNPATREAAAKELLDLYMEEIEDKAEDLKGNKEFKEAVEDKKVKFDYAVIEGMEGGEEDTESQKELRKAEKEQTKFTNLDELGDLIFRADEEVKELGEPGYDKLYVDFYGKADDGKEVRVHIYRVDLGDGIGRENHLTNKDKEEIEEYLTKEYNKLEK